MPILSKDEIEKLRKFDTPTVCNALEAFDIMPRSAGFGMPGMVQRVSYKKPMVGYAMTAKVSALHAPTKAQADMQMRYYEILAKMEGPSIAVIKDIDTIPIGSYWGEVQATIHKSLGSVGAITEGGVRDIPAVKELGYYFMSTHVLVSHAYIHTEDYNIPVEICGITVHPGDLIHADMHGFVIIPKEIAPRLYNACKGISDAELPVLNPCRDAIKRGVRPDMEELASWRKAMIAARTLVK